MAFTTIGKTALMSRIIGEATYAVFSNANAHIGVGNGTTEFALSQTDLQGASKTRKAMESGYPTRSGAQLTFRSVYGTSDANYAWEEWGIFNASTAGEMLSRKVENKGTKTAGATWTFTVTIEP